MASYPSPKEVQAIYDRRDRDLARLALRASSPRGIDVGDLHALDRLGRVRVANELWGLCSEVARQALLTDEHAHVRSCAALASTRPLGSKLVGIGDYVRSFDFERSDDCYVEGVVKRIDSLEGCLRYVISVERRVFDSKECVIGTPEVCPPVNGTPMLMGDSASFVVLSSRDPEAHVPRALPNEASIAPTRSASRLSL